jgi:hypothetical protein
MNVGTADEESCHTERRIDGRTREELRTRGCGKRTDVDACLLRDAHNVGTFWKE